jgi:hypothetical protein
MLHLPEVRRRHSHGRMARLVRSVPTRIDDRGRPDTLFEVGSKAESCGACMVITTAGFQFGPDLKIERVIDFRPHVEI